MVVGCDLADRLGLRVGDRVAVYSSGVLAKLSESRGQTNGIEGAVADEFTIRGIFDVGFGEYNSLIVATSLEDAQELNLMSATSAEALQIKLDDPYKAAETSRQLASALARDFVLSKGLTPDSFRDIDTLALELQRAEDPIAKFLAGALSEQSQRMLAAFKPGISNPAPLKVQLAQDLARIIRGASIYAPERFANVSLRAETKSLLGGKMDSESVVLLNRHLLQDAFPSEFFLSPYLVTTWKEEDPQIFNSLAVEKTMMFFLLFFIMIVAGFGIVNSQITFVVQKTSEIGILKSLGATNRQILWLFLSQSVVVAILGVGIGFGMALLALHYRNEFLFFMRRVTGIEILPASIYEVYQLPALIQASDILVICGTAFLTCVLAGLFPAWKASRMQPVEALRYE
jgi:ABC-type lipoprotein release transport system permease subunit